MKVIHRLFFSILFFSLFPFGLAEPLNVFFGTAARQRAFITPPSTQTTGGFHFQVGSQDRFPCISYLHPNGKILYAVGRWEGGMGAIVSDQRWRAQGIHTHGLSRWWRLPHCRSSERKFLLAAQYGGGSIALFPLDSSVNWVNLQ